ncbi:MAG: beta-lactamase family protein [Sediminibacterium sp.]|nr:beta-lactamase family protein [Sediminibacterium sp.]
MQITIQHANPVNMSLKNCSICLKVSAVFIFLLFFQFADAQRKQVQVVSKFPEADAKLEAAAKELGGEVVAVVYKDGAIIWQKAIGTDFTAKSQAPIMNASQWLTAALVMSYVEQGKLSLSDKVSKYIPLFTKYSKGYITIKDCLAHLTGIEADPGHYSNGKKFASLEEEVDNFITKKEIESNPGLEFRYSNVGLNIAGRVLEIVAKRGFEQLMQERITRPLMMRNTSFSSFYSVNPSAGALSSPNDYINFLSMLLNKGMFNGKRILSEQSITEMLTIRTTPPMMKYVPKGMEGYSYGLGQWILEADEKGIGTLIAGPGMTGTWPMIDLCRGYALLIFTKGDLNEEKKNIYMDVKASIDALIPPNCK